MSLRRYQQHFAAAGIGILAFDYRHLGESEDLPRQRLSLRRHRHDLNAGVDFVRELPDADISRVALWGTSPIVGPPGSLAAVTARGAEDGRYSTVDPGGGFDNRVAAANTIGIALTSAKRAARRVSAPLLVCVSHRETLMDPRHAEDVARSAPRGEMRHYAGDHFEIYHRPLLDDLLIDQTAFLEGHLHVSRA